MRSGLLFPAALTALLLALLPWPWAGHPGMRGGVEIAPAVIQSVTRIDRRWSLGRLASIRETPHVVVRLQVAPAEGGDSALAIDAVDVGSSSELELGSVREVFYPEGAPTAAQLIGATRNYRARNRAKMAAALAGILSGLAAVAMAAYGVRQIRRASRLSSRAAPAVPAHPR
jgi:hypothetical protein